MNDVQSLSPSQAIGATFALVGSNPLLTLGVPVLVSCLFALVLFLMPTASFLGIAFSLTWSWVTLYLIARLLLQSGVQSFDESEIPKRVTGKFAVHFGFTIIIGLAGGLLIAIVFGLTWALFSGIVGPLMVAIGADLDAVSNDLLFVNTANVLTDLSMSKGTQLWLCFGFFSVISLLVFNFLMTVWFLVAPAMVAEQRGLAAMGRSSALVGPHFANVFIISLVVSAISVACGFFPLILILGGWLADNLMNHVFSGVFQGVGYGIALCASVIVWRSLAGKDQDASSVFN